MYRTCQERLCAATREEKAFQDAVDDSNWAAVLRHGNLQQSRNVFAFETTANRLEK